jgi:hypothetical protein
MSGKSEIFQTNYRLDFDFYPCLSRCADTLMEHMDKNFWYKDFLRWQQFEEPFKSKEEYFLEFLSCGVYFREYAKQAVQTSDISIRTLKKLVGIRRNHSHLKKQADEMRATLAPALLYHGEDSVLDGFRVNANSFARLLEWMEATGEYSQECARFQLWKRFFFKYENHLQEAVELAEWFENFSQVELGDYTVGVEGSSRNALITHMQREDFFLCSRSRRLYHLNMLGAELMNRALQAAFDESESLAVLLPGCMRSDESACRAERCPEGLRCTGCSSTCSIGKIRRKEKERGYSTWVIPHSTDFSRQLRGWRKKNHGLIASACVLHLISGGYEMKELGLAAQCIFLNFSGCRKHWHDEGLQTYLNEERLDEMIAQWRSGKLRAQSA